MVPKLLGIGILVIRIFIFTGRLRILVPVLFYLFWMVIPDAEYSAAIIISKAFLTLKMIGV